MLGLIGPALGLKAAGGAASAIYNNAALAPYRTALANRNSAPANIVMLGHSWYEGYNAATLATRMVSRVADGLRTALPTSGAAGVAGTCYRPATYTGDIFQSETAWSATHGAGGTTGSGGFGAHDKRFASVGDGYTYTTPAGCDQVDLYFYGINGSSGSVAISIDGGGAVTHNIGAQATGYSTWNSGALSAASHTVKITTSVVGGFINIYCGMVMYGGDKTKGIKVYDAGHNAMYSGNDYLPFSGSVMATITTPALLIIGVAERDFGLSTAKATFKTNLQTIISGARTYGGANLPVMLVSWNSPGGIAGTTVPWSDYQDACREICDADTKTCWMDGSDVVPACVVTPASPPLDAIGFWDTDRQHPTASIGVPIVANKLVAVLTS